jgi:hypothetical protein
LTTLSIYLPYYLLIIALLVKLAKIPKIFVRLGGIEPPILTPYHPDPNIIAPVRSAASSEVSSDVIWHVA